LRVGALILFFANQGRKMGTSAFGY